MTDFRIKTMDCHSLFLACRTGDLSKVEFLVTVKEVDVNIRDRWDSSPLFYACLCGHEEIVKYLLDNGAKCEANTFDGERCMYGSLTNAIRNMIRDYKQVTASTMRRDAYVEFLRKLLDSGMYSDIVFDVHGHQIPAHRCILAARSEFFQEMLSTRWRDRHVVKLNNRLLYYKAFKSLLSWLYTLRMEVDLDDVNSVMLVARQCRHDDLMQELEDRIRHVTSFQAAKPNVNVKVVNVEPQSDCSKLQDKLKTLADHAIPVGVGNADFRNLPFTAEHEQIHPDVIFAVDGFNFECHRAFFNCRSDYFRALEVDHFNEQSETVDTELPVIRLNGVSASVFMQIVYYVYTDQCDLNENNVFDVLYTGDLYLLPGLKRYCGLELSKHMDPENVTMILRTARLFNLPRLEGDCAAYIADNLDPVLQNKEFADFIREEADSVVNREDCDSIPFIDDIRHYVNADRVLSFSDIYEVDRDMNKIDVFLMTLGFDA